MSAAPHESSDPQGHGTHGTAAPHDASHPTTGTFVTVWLVLGLLTVVEIFVPVVYSSEWNRHTKWILLVTLALGKALLVAAYFMHLKWEKTWLKYIAAMPLYMGLAAAVLMVEQAWRNSLS